MDTPVLAAVCHTREETLAEGALSRGSEWGLRPLHARGHRHPPGPVLPQNLTGRFPKTSLLLAGGPGSEEALAFQCVLRINRSFLTE